MSFKQIGILFLIFTSTLFGITTECLARTPSKKTVNCLSSSIQKRRPKLCSNVIDPVKFKNGDKENIDCTKVLPGSNEAGICMKVNDKEQRKFHKIARAGNL